MPFVQPAYPNRLQCIFDGNGLPCPDPLSRSQKPAQTRLSQMSRRLPTPFGAVPAVVPILCWICGANLIDAIPGVHAGQVDDAHAFVDKIYRATLCGASSCPALLGEASGTQFHRFVDGLVLPLVWYSSTEPAPPLTDPRNLHLHFRGEILSIVAALIVNPRFMCNPTATLDPYFTFGTIP